MEMLNAFAEGLSWGGCLFHTHLLSILVGLSNSVASRWPITEPFITYRPIQHYTRFANQVKQQAIRCTACNVYLISLPPLTQPTVTLQFEGPTALAMS